MTSDLEILLSRAEDGDECPLCHAGTVEFVVSARVFWVKCRGECGNSTMSQNPPQDAATIARRWGSGAEDITRPMSHAKDESAIYVPTWAKPK
ncbi:hypothetical protein LCGC14_2209440 [marine sediment metagenome]|uniref:Uncharacterized protein n=1 Tax=marine sediment metagenome TaxID=412755 RepID=A0A0F9G9Y6_9ZZZZ